MSGDDNHSDADGANPGDGDNGLKGDIGRALRKFREKVNGLVEQLEDEVRGLLSPPPELIPIPVRSRRRR